MRAAIARRLRKAADRLDPVRNRHIPAPTPINVSICGALDPVAVGREVERVLAKYNRTTGR